MSDALKELISVLESNLKPVGHMAQRHANAIYALLIGPSKQIDKVCATFVLHFDKALKNNVQPAADFLEDVYGRIQDKIFASKETLHETAVRTKEICSGLMTDLKLYMYKKHTYSKVVKPPSQMIMFSMDLPDLYNSFKKFGAAVRHGADESFQSCVDTSKGMWKAINSYLADMFVSNPDKAQKYKTACSSIAIYSAEVQGNIGDNILWHERV